VIRAPPNSVQTNESVIIALMDPQSAFAASSMNPYDYEKQGRVLDWMQQETQTQDTPIEALSEVNMGALLVVFPTWHAVAHERGIFNKRIEFLSRAGYTDTGRLMKRQKGLRGRDGMIVDGLGHDGSSLFELSWGCGGPISEQDAEAERDRVYAVIAARMQALGESAQP
jgi:hypothetical protein